MSWRSDRSQADSSHSAAQSSNEAAPASAPLLAELANVPTAVRALRRPGIIAIPTDTLYGEQPTDGPVQHGQLHLPTESCSASGLQEQCSCHHMHTVKCEPPPFDRINKQHHVNIGLAALADSSEGIAAIYAAKQRQLHAPLAVCVGDSFDISRYAETEHLPRGCANRISVIFLPLPFPYHCVYGLERHAMRASAAHAPAGRCPVTTAHRVQFLAGSWPNCCSWLSTDAAQHRV